MVRVSSAPPPPLPPFGGPEGKSWRAGGREKWEKREEKEEGVTQARGNDGKGQTEPRPETQQGLAFFRCGEAAEKRASALPPSSLTRHPIEEYLYFRATRGKKGREGSGS